MSLLQYIGVFLIIIAVVILAMVCMIAGLDRMEDREIESKGFDKFEWTVEFGEINE